MAMFDACCVTGGEQKVFARSGRVHLGASTRRLTHLSGFFLPLHRSSLNRSACRCAFEHSAQRVSRVKFPAPEAYGLGRNDGSQAVSCDTEKSVQLKVTLTELRKQAWNCSGLKLRKFSAGMFASESRKQVIKVPVPMSKEWLSYSSYLGSGHWKKLRRQAFERDNWKCIKCGSELNLRGHHLKYRGNLHACTVDDIQTLCRRCHDRKHRGRKFNDFMKIPKEHRHLVWLLLKFSSSDKPRKRFVLNA